MGERMNYENFYADMQPLEKNMKDSLAALQKLFKAVGRETEGGDIKGLARDLDVMAREAAAAASAIADMQETVAGFDAKAYFESGEFAEQMLEACHEKGVDVRGEFPVYEMFPYRVRLDVENQDVYMDRKKVQSVRPASFVETVKAGQEKLNRASFNALTFVGELSDAYDLALLKSKSKKSSGVDVYLTNLYKFMTPMSRFRKDYDQQSFAFDLARLHASGIETTKNGRRFQFGPSRKIEKAIRILDREGREHLLATICFYDQEVEE